MAASTAAAGLTTRLHSLCPSSSSRSDVGLSRRSSTIACALPNPSDSPLSNLFAASQNQVCSSHSTLFFALKRAARKVSLRVRADVGEELDQITGFDSDGDFQQAPPAGAKLYVGNLPWKVDSESLAEVFESAGKVELVEVVYDRMSGKSRGFGFVTMGSIEEAQRAIDTMNGMELDGRPLRVNFPQVGAGEGRPPRAGGLGGGERRAPRPDSPNKLYVGNLSWGMDDFGLEDLFSEFGKVVEAKVVMDRDTGRSRGFGFVTFESESHCSQAIQGLNGVDVDGRTIRVNLASDKPVRAGGFSGGRGGGGYGGGRSRDDGYGGSDDGY